MDMDDARFVGGPLDGQVRRMERVSMGPLRHLPLECCIRVAAPRLLYAIARGETVPEDEAKAVVHFRYVRKASPLDEGPIWLYVPAPEFADAPDPLDPETDPTEYERLARDPLTVEDILRRPN